MMNLRDAYKTVERHLPSGDWQHPVQQALSMLWREANANAALSAEIEAMRKAARAREAEVEATVRAAWAQTREAKADLAAAQREAAALREGIARLADEAEHTAALLRPGPDAASWRQRASRLRALLTPEARKGEGERT